MKKINLFSFALAGLMLGACSSETELVTSNQGPEWNANGKGYVNLAIQLPTQPSSRADAAFNDGTPAEYQVNDATLILFVTNEQGVDVINSAYDMDLKFSSVGGSTDQITTTSKITQKINEIENPSNIKALVVLNNNDLLKVGSDGSLSDKNEKTLIGATLDGLNDALKGADDNFSWHDDGFLMSNAVMASSDDPKSANLVDPLVTIDVKNICSTKAEAEAKPAATIYVERAEAKITLKAVDSETTSGLKYTIEGWGVDNYNKTNKLVRTTSTTDDFNKWKGYVSAHAPEEAKSDYRFLGATPIATGQNLYRFYWGDDYNYGSNGVNDLQRNSSSSLNLKTADGETPAYCFENTTNVENMLETTLTRVIVKAQFNNGNSFYIADDDNTKIWQAGTDDLTNEIINRMLKDVTFLGWVKTNTNTDLAASDFNVKLGTEAGVAGITVTLNDNGKGKLKDNTTLEEAETAATDAANRRIKLTYYAGGIAYYPVYIKHFDDQTQTPWEKSYTDVASSGIYENNSEQNYLGRYGVLRNNWYDITVKSIKGLGSAVIEDPDPVPVDKVESYISVDINILSWAKRTQNVDL